jgi:hypothetical protein
MAEPDSEPSVGRFARVGWKWFAGGVATIGAVIAIVFELFPSARPSDPCAVESATFGDVAPTQHVTRGSYFALQNATTKGIPASRLRQPGVLIEFRVNTQGYVHKSLTVSTRVLTATDAPVANGTLNDPLQMRLTPSKCQGDGTKKVVWSEIPARKGSYRIQLILSAPNDPQVDEHTIDVRAP